MFRRKANLHEPTTPPPVERITSVIGDDVSLKGKLSGSGGIRIEGAYDGEIELDGLFVIGVTGRVTCPQVKAKHVIVAGALRGDILAEKVEIRATGRVWGDVVTVAMSTEEGAFLRGQIRMEEKINLGIKQNAPAVQEVAPPADGATGKPPAATAEQTAAVKRQKKEEPGKAKN
ncbi:MAG: bactofilin family protein [Anaerolineales bacterium]